MNETGEFMKPSAQLWTVVRFPAGMWSGGGRVSDPDYAECEVYRIPAESFEKAIKKAQSTRARLVKSGKPLPKQTEPYQAKVSS